MRVWLPWRRPHRAAAEIQRGSPSAQQTGAGASADGTPDQGHALRQPSPFHAFNRYEIKYLVSVEDARDLQSVLARRLEADDNSGLSGYGVWSLYYDTVGLRFYWEKIEGIRFRRKLRIRHYGTQASVVDDTPVFVEIKQRVNRVTQKRRVRMSYRQARLLCDEQVVPEDASDRSRPFLDEVAGLVARLRLRPCTITGYQRRAFVGRGSDIGLRVTIDRRVRGRDRDLDLRVEGENRYIVPPQRVIVEVKANERVPYWLTDLTARMNLQVVRVSKYCQSVEAFDKAPRSVFHIPDDIDDDADAVRHQLTPR